MTLTRLRRLRWAVRGALVLAVAASVAANVLHARANPVSQTIAAWPPLALLINIELIARVPMHRRDLAAVRLVATGAIATIAAWVSYWHMAAVASRFGESADAAHLLPLSVDGLVIVASVCLVELGGRIAAPAAAVTATPAAETTAETTATVRPSRRPSNGRSTAARVARLAAGNPAITAADVATRLDIAERTARRHLATTRPLNGHALLSGGGR